MHAPERFSHAIYTARRPSNNSRTQWFELHTRQKNNVAQTTPLCEAARHNVFSVRAQIFRMVKNNHTNAAVLPGGTGEETERTFNEQNEWQR